MILKIFAESISHFYSTTIEQLPHCQPIVDITPSFFQSLGLIVEHCMGMSVFRVFLVHIFPHSNQKNSVYGHFSRNTFRACYKIIKHVGRTFDTSRCYRKWFSISCTKRKLRNCEWPLKLLREKNQHLLGKLIFDN